MSLLVFLIFISNFGCRLNDITYLIWCNLRSKFSYLKLSGCSATLRYIGIWNACSDMIQTIKLVGVVKLWFHLENTYWIFQAAISAYAKGSHPGVLPPLIKYQFVKPNPVVSENKAELKINERHFSESGTFSNNFIKMINLYIP